jgi:hypothetical protein
MVVAQQHVSSIISGLANGYPYVRLKMYRVSEHVMVSVAQRGIVCAGKDLELGVAGSSLFWHAQNRDFGYKLLVRSRYVYHEKKAALPRFVNDAI